MKKTLCMLLALALCLFGAAVAETSIANPWEDATEGDIAEAIGAAFGIPEGVEDAEYSLMPDEGLAEMRFTLEDMEYVARIQPAEAFRSTHGGGYGLRRMEMITGKYGGHAWFSFDADAHVFTTRLIMSVSEG